MNKKPTRGAPVPGLPWADRPWTKHYSPGVPADLKLPKGSLVDLMDSSVRRFGSKTALEFFGARTSYRELGTQISKVAAGLKKLGVKAGDRVALVLPNCPQHVIAFHAALRLGAVVVEHNPLYTDRELRHQFEDHGATVAIVWDKAVDRVLQLPADVGLRSIVSVELIPAMPLGKRLALRLPLPAARKARAALSAGKPRPRRPRRRRTPHGAAVARPPRGGRAEEAASAPRRGGPGGAAVHERHHRSAEGRHADAREPAGQRRAGPRLGAGAQGRPRNRVRGAAHVPRLRADAVHDLRAEHRRQAGAVPQVRRRPGAEGAPEVPADVPAGGAADLRPARGRRRPGAASPRRHPLFHLRGDEPADRDGGRPGRRRPAAT